MSLTNDELLYIWAKNQISDHILKKPESRTIWTTPIWYQLKDIKDDVTYDKGWTRQWVTTWVSAKFLCDRHRSLPTMPSHLIHWFWPKESFTSLRYIRACLSGKTSTLRVTYTLHYIYRQILNFGEWQGNNNSFGYWSFLSTWCGLWWFTGHIPFSLFGGMAMT